MRTASRQSSRWQSQFDLSENLTCVLDDEFRVVYCNRAWDLAANVNSVEQATAARLCGRSLLSFVPNVLEYYYSRILEIARKKHTVVFADYECNTPSRHRKYRMTIAPVPDSSLLAIVHTLLMEGTIPYRVHSSIDHDYGMRETVTMCAQCRRTRRLLDNVWDWIPEFVHRAPRRVKHGICDDCIALYCQAFEPME